MLLPLGCDRRDLGRPALARLHRDAAACGCVGTQRHALLAGAAGRQCEFKRRADALADRKRGVAGERSRSESAGAVRLECRTVPRARGCARPVEHRA